MVVLIDAECLDSQLGVVGRVVVVWVYFILSFQNMLYITPD